VSVLLVPNVVLSSTVSVVNLPVFGAVLPIVGGLDKSKVPPKVKLPLLVTVPDRVMPDTVPVPLTLVTVPVVGVDQDGTPEAKVNTWPLDPAAKNVVALAADWYGTLPVAPPAMLVAVVALVALVAVVAVAALPEIEPVMKLETVRSVNVPTPVMPEYVPLNRAESMVPEVIWVAPIAMLVFDAAVSWPWALTVKVGTADPEP